MANLPDIARVEEIMRDIADSEIMSRFRTLDDDEVWHKKPGDIATIADIESERRLVEALCALLPGSIVIAEEMAQHKDDIARLLTGADPVWIIDPIDGTSNFAAGRDRFAVIVAFWHGGAVRAGWILAPALGRIAVAEEGGGAWSGTTRLRAANAIPLDRTSGFIGRRLREDKSIAERFGGIVNLRCCGLQYLQLAAGESHFAHYRGLRPWDHAAGDLILREAGGVSEGLDGQRYNPGAPDRHGLLAACGRTVWNGVADTIRPMVEGLPRPR
ncbi:MAG: inositol monophosphatase [Alphaproteobacteria bacterium]